MNIDQRDVEQYLSEVKKAVEQGVSLYIKLNKLEHCFVIVISFHEQRDICVHTILNDREKS